MLRPMSDTRQTDMIRHNKKKHILAPLAAVALVGVLLLPACGPILPAEQARDELVSFMLDHTLRQELGANGDYVQSSGHLWVEAPADAALVVWAPPAPNLDDTSLTFLNTDDPARVWWFAGQHLAEVTDKKEAIQAFRQLHFSAPLSNKGWDYYEFGILSLTGGNRTAQVYVGVSCGPLCGHGTIYTLQRNESGQWEITDTQPRWIS